MSEDGKDMEETGEPPSAAVSDHDSFTAFDEDDTESFTVQSSEAVAADNIPVGSGEGLKDVVSAVPETNTTTLLTVESQSQPSTHEEVAEVDGCPSDSKGHSQLNEKNEDSVNSDADDGWADFDGDAVDSGQVPDTDDLTSDANLASNELNEDPSQLRQPVPIDLKDASASESGDRKIDSNAIIVDEEPVDHKGDSLPEHAPHAEQSTVGSPDDFNETTVGDAVQSRNDITDSELEPFCANWAFANETEVVNGANDGSDWASFGAANASQDEPDQSDGFANFANFSSFNQSFSSQGLETPPDKPLSHQADSVLNRSVEDDFDEDFDDFADFSSQPNFSGDSPMPEVDSTETSFANFNGHFELDHSLNTTVGEGYNSVDSVWDEVDRKCIPYMESDAIVSEEPLLIQDLFVSMSITSEVSKQIT